MVGLKMQYYRDANDKHIIVLGITVDEFIKCNPPCKECLVRSICLVRTTLCYFRTTKSCDKLHKFLKDKYFIFQER